MSAMSRSSPPRVEKESRHPSTARGTKAGHVLLSLLVGLPIVILITPVIALWLSMVILCSTPAALISQYRYRRWLRRHFGRAGRLMHPDELRRRVDLGEGTLIIDGASKHEMNRVLWTPARVAELGPPPVYITKNVRPGVPFATADFISWCRPRYTDPITGSAKVVDTRAHQWIRRLSHAASGTELLLLSDALTPLPLTECMKCRADFIPTAGRCPGCGEALPAGPPAAIC